MSLTKATYSMIQGASVNVNDFIPSTIDTATTDCTAYIQAAMDSQAGAAEIVFGMGQTYRCNSTLYFRYGQITLQGRGATIETHAATGIDAQTEGATPYYPAYSQIRNLIITAPEDGTTAVKWHAQYGYCENVNIFLSGDSQQGWYLADSQTGGVTSIYYSTWVNCGVLGKVGSGNTDQTGWYFGQTSQYGPNGNVIIGGNNTGLTLGFSVRGAGNIIENVVVQSSDECVLVSNLAGAEGVGCSNNMFLNVYMEGDAGATGFNITTYATDTYVLGGFATGFSGGGYFVNNGVRTVHLKDGNFAANQITFPATQVASADPNTLDDYEEGAWTPVVKGSSTAGTYELATASGKYTKVGNAISVSCRVKAAASVTGGGTGSVLISGLPFTYNGDLAAAFAFVNGIAFTGSYTAIQKASSGASNEVILSGVANTGTVTYVPISAFVANGVIEFSFTYLV